VEVVTRKQCITCRRFMIRERAIDGSDPQICVECYAIDPLTRDVPGFAPGIPLRCDGDHAAPVCEDPQCWRRDQCRWVHLHADGMGASNCQLVGGHEGPHQVLGGFAHEGSDRWRLM
jgi:hypothetical protein